MKNLSIKRPVYGILTMLLLCIGGTAMAQSGQAIEEVKIIKNDKFTQIKSLLNDNFDYQEVDADSGVYISEVRFEVDGDGIVRNIETDGTNQYVDQEIKETLEEISYEFNDINYSNTISSNTYVMPVTLILDDE